MAVNVVMALLQRLVYLPAIKGRMMKKAKVAGAITKF
jgi:hypothetical protein